MENVVQSCMNVLERICILEVNYVEILIQYLWKIQYMNGNVKEVEHEKMLSVISVSRIMNIMKIQVNV